MARYENIAEYSQILADHFTRQAEMLRDVMGAQNAEYARRLEDMENNQRDIAAKLDEAVDVLHEERRTREKVPGGRPRPARPLRPAGHVSSTLRPSGSAFSTSAGACRLRRELVVVLVALGVEVRLDELDGVVARDEGDANYS